MPHGSSNSHEEFLRKRRNRKIARYCAILFLIVAIIAGLAYLAHRPQIRIRSVVLSGETIVSPSDVQTSVLSYLSGSYLWIFPKNNAFLYPNNGLKKYLQNNFERIDTINIHLKNFHTLEIDITERKPIGMWCDTLPLTGTEIGTTTSAENNSSSEHCYFLDSNSTIFSEAPDFSGDAYFKYYGLVSNIAPIGTEYIASTTEFSDITNFIQNVQQLSLNPAYLVASSNNEFSLVLADGGQIYFNTMETPMELSQNLQALLQTPALSQNMSKLDYIDLRFGNKLYYKLK